MKNRFLAASLALLAASATTAPAIVFTNNTTIATSDTNYNGLDLVVSNCTVTIDGFHSFASLLVTGGGRLTHSASVTGTFTITNSIVDEQIVLSQNSILYF